MLRRPHFIVSALLFGELWKREYGTKHFLKYYPKYLKEPCSYPFCVIFQRCSSDHKSQHNIVIFLILEKALSLKFSRVLTSVEVLMPSSYARTAIVLGDLTNWDPAGP